MQKINSEGIINCQISVYKRTEKNTHYKIRLWHVFSLGEYILTFPLRFNDTIILMINFNG